MNTRLLTLYIITLVLISCERDDICSEITQTTSQIVFDFYDATSPDDLKSVPNVFAIGLNDLDQEVPITTLTAANANTLSLPLRTDANLTRFLLYRNYEDDGSGTINGNSDIIEITYTIEDIYVSRACGFKAVFNDLTFSVEADSDNWLINYEIINTTVDNELETHINLFH